MRKVALIACVASKKDEPSKAIELYNSPLFKKSVTFCTTQNVDAIYILSAKHGLVRGDVVIAPYKKTLNKMNAKDRLAWANMVIEQINAVEDLCVTNFVVLAGMKYREHLVGKLDNCDVPMKGLGIGQQLQWLNKKIYK